jgi:peptide/nickel transport system permease protein
VVNMTRRLALFYRSNLEEPVHIFMKNRMALTGLVILLLFFIIATFAPFIATHDATAMNRLESGRAARLQPPSSTFLFGTTDLGRDVFSQIVMGTRVALLVGFLTALIVTFIGTNIGLISGYYGGWIDNLLMRFVDILYSIPFIPFVIVLVSLLKPSLWNIILAIALLTWRSVTRIVRSQVLSLVQRPYVKAARVAGASDFRIIFVHIAPNVLPLAFLEMAFMIGWAIIAESSVSFIGFGDPALISWGQILHASFLSGAVRTAWWWVIPPGLAIVVLVTSVFMITTGLEDVNNPRLRRR